MVLIDANAILRYILYDNADMAEKVCELIEDTKVFIRYEVLAEVVYVLNKVYSMPRSEIGEYITKVLQLPNVETESEVVLLLALETYSDVNIDFVDCILHSLNATYGYGVFTFDKQLNTLIN